MKSGEGFQQDPACDSAKTIAHWKKSCGGTGRPDSASHVALAAVAVAPLAQVRREAVLQYEKLTAGEIFRSFHAPPTLRFSGFLKSQRPSFAGHGPGCVRLLKALLREDSDLSGKLQLQLTMWVCIRRSCSRVGLGLDIIQQSNETSRKAEKQMN